MSDTAFSLPRPTDVSPADRLVELYLAGECTLAEQAAMERWIAANPEAGNIFRVLRAYSAREADLAGTGPELLSGVRAVVNRIPAIGTSRAAKSQTAPTHQHLSPGLARLATWTGAMTKPWTGIGIVASVVAVLFCVSLGGSSKVANEQRVYSTTTRQAHLTLDDGTEVILAPRTTLRLLTFNAQGRTVSVDGEARFTVVQSEGVPFIVHTRGVQTRVLGTTFVVRRYAADTTARILVTTGKVVVIPEPHPDRGVVLVAGHGALVSESAVTNMDVTRYPEWLDSERIFREALASDVLETLSRWYGYQFQLDDPSIAREIITVSLNTTSPQTALATLFLCLGVDGRVEGNAVTLTRGTAMRTSRQQIHSQPELGSKEGK
jgi:ferric-dicitrate binding protein FerR (iron transport regulator)